MPNAAWFFLAFAALLVGYFIYGKFVERLFGPNPGRTTPANSMCDSVDYVKLPTWKIFLIQLLNIAGVGPVFGPIMGALYGPAALLWIVIGTLVAGGVHDYFSGMMSLRYNGKSVADVVGYTLGNGFKQFMRGFSLVLLVLVGVVFVSAPAGILSGLTPAWAGMGFWLAAIFIYYFLATILPIDLVIARLYPLFAVVLLVMAFGVAGGLIFKGYGIYQWPVAEGASVFSNVHPKGLPMWPLMFITIACGALSGFHATQSPLMARCLANEGNGRLVFYGAMVAEGVIGLIWATAGLSFYETPGALQAALSNPGGAAYVVREVSLTLLGPVGGILAILGVVILPISSGDTAFRAARLLVSDFTGISQKKALSRLMIAVPLFVIGVVLAQVDFSIIWRYFGWSNQSLATVCLWAGAAYCVRRGVIHWPVSLPAVYMTATCTAYIMGAPEGFRLPWTVSYTIGFGAAAVAMAWFLFSVSAFRQKILLELPIPDSK